MPQAVAVSETCEQGRESELFAIELEIVRKAVVDRRKEFANSSACARRALAQLGATPTPLLRDPKGAPLWPPGFVGSISHTKGYCVAVASRATMYAALGVDVELDGDLPAGVLGLVATESEIKLLARLSIQSPSISWDRLIFSAKESVYKAWYSITGCWLDFHDVEITIEPDSGRFSVHPRVGGTSSARQLADYEGLWTTGLGLVATAVLVQ